MGLKFWDAFMSRKAKGGGDDIVMKELYAAAEEYRIRELCWSICVNMIANAVGRCEIRTFRDGAEFKGREYWLWNIEPNTNQNSTAFLHKLVAKLYEDNEVLIISTRRRDGGEGLVVADQWMLPENYPSKQNEYRGVVAGNVSYDKTFRENDVMHLKLNNSSIRPVLDGMYKSYVRLVNAAIKNYEWNKGQHWKVTVADMARGQEGWANSFQEMMQAQVKPFFDSNGAILPEFSGYKYERMEDTSGDSRDIWALVEDIFNFTARGFLIPAVLVNGQIEGTADANKRFLTNCIDPLCDQLQEEGTRKRYGFAQWQAGNYMMVDSSSIIHFDIFENAANVEKLVGSGAYSINDVRRAANQAAITEPWADEHYMTLNIATMDEAARQLDQKGGEET